MVRQSNKFGGVDVGEVDHFEHHLGVPLPACHGSPSTFIRTKHFLVFCGV